MGCCKGVRVSVPLLRGWWVFASLKDSSPGFEEYPGQSKLPSSCQYCSCPKDEYMTQVSEVIRYLINIKVKNSP